MVLRDTFVKNLKIKRKDVLNHQLFSFNDSLIYILLFTLQEYALSYVQLYEMI